MWGRGRVPSVSGMSTALSRSLPSTPDRGRTGPAEGAAELRVSPSEIDSRLRGRHHETQALDRLLVDVRSGRSRALVLRGEAGIGKTALLEHLAGRASGCHLVRVVGVESEMEFAFSGVHQLCAPFIERLERLPVPQRTALNVAFGLGEGGAPDRFLVSLAVLNLLSDVAEERPVVCVVDDVQWLDQASVHALAFVARRLLAESVALVFATRPDVVDHPLRHVPELHLTGLAVADSRALLRSALRGPL